MEKLEKKLLTDEELDQVVGGSHISCDYMLHHTDEFAGKTLTYTYYCGIFDATSRTRTVLIDHVWNDSNGDMYVYVPRGGNSGDLKEDRNTSIVSVRGKEFYCIKYTTSTHNYFS